ncbi:MAG: branched-chain amino acid transport system ATP-binding protein [Spirochaetes bacterium]|nr:MAG: branched-chain amino acid transport system ATP-binding protein [Spirochaetota bacterium]
MLLEVEGLNVYYGEAIHALRDLSFSIAQGEIVSIIGANGAGKSTLMWTLVGLLKPRSGRISMGGKILKPIPHLAVAEGIALVPERRRLFPNLTVKENLSLGGYLRKDRAGLAKDRDYVFELFPILKERLAQYAGTLSGGQQQMLAIGRALMCKPRLLLLDEPSLGLAPVLVDQVFSAIQEIADTGTTILLVEQNALEALQISRRAYVLEVGRIVLEGSGMDLLKDKIVREAYLGKLGGQTP